MGKAKIYIGVMAGCVFLLAGCSGKIQNQVGIKEPVVTGAAVTASAVAEEQKQIPQKTDEKTVQKTDHKTAQKTDGETNQKTEGQNIFNDCATTELPLKKLNFKVKETRLGMPGGNCSYFYVKNNSEIIADDWLTDELDTPATSYVLSENIWEEKRTPFDVARENEEITSAESVVQRANGDYVFVSGRNAITRMSAKGKIKRQVSVQQLLSKRGFIAAMVYLGDGRAILQTQDDYFMTDVYEQQDESMIHLYLVNIKTGKVERTYPDGWRLCGSADGKYFFIENKKRIAKVKIMTGEMVKKYSTEAIWSQGWSDENADMNGIYFHDRGITWCTFDGKLYAKHVGGVFRLDEENLCWEQLISRKDDFQMGPMYDNVFVMLDNNKLMLMGYRYDEECATDCYMYQLK